MAIVTSDFVSALTTTVKGDFHREYEAATAVEGWRELAMVVPSSTESVTQYWLSAVPGMQDVTHDALRLKDMDNFDWTLTDKTYKAGFDVSRRAIEDDQLGWIPVRVANLAQEAAAHPGRLLFGQIRDGNTSAVTTFDGGNLFSTHTIGGQTIDNDLTGASTVAAGISNALQAMMAFKDEEGREMGLAPNIIVVPPSLNQETYAALNASQASLPTTIGPLVPAASNNGVWKSAGYTVVINPFETDASAFYMFYSRGAMKPFIYQERVSPSLEAVDSPESESGVLRDKFIYSVRARYVVGPADPRHAIRVNL